MAAQKKKTQSPVKTIVKKIEKIAMKLEANVHVISENLTEASRVITSVAMRVKTLEDRVFGGKKD